jgi:hypothetical protein
MRLCELYNSLSTTGKLFELKKDTLKSYVKKAGSDKVDRASSDSFISGKAGDIYNTADETKKDSNRDKGIGKALDKLAKEDIDEAKTAKKVVVKSPPPRNFVAKAVTRKTGSGSHSENKFTRKEKHKDKQIDEETGE